TGERMEPAAGPAERGCGPAGGTSAGGRESGGQGDWAGGAGGNWMATHPTFTEMMSLDISDSAQIYAAFVVYLDLLEGRNWHEVKHVGVAELQLVCLHAREREQDSLQVMVPVPVHISLTASNTQYYLLSDDGCLLLLVFAILSGDVSEDLNYFSCIIW
uniref:tRNA splicing endonuclease subunit 15 n=1 Tax=Accipiter nisus TaxID=211598 RepID=A0A8B9RV46_9AVES